MSQLTETLVSYLLITGQEIIAKEARPVVNDEHHLSKPRVIQLQLAQNGQLGFVLLPLSLNSVDTEQVIKSSAIVGWPQKINPAIEKSYMEQTTGLLLAK